MRDKDLLLGIDIGTTGTKCSVYDFRGFFDIGICRLFVNIRNTDPFFGML